MRQKAVLYMLAAWVLIREYQRYREQKARGSYDVWDGL